MNSGAQRRGWRPSWRSLRTDPDYVADWRANAGPTVHEAPPFPFRRQTEADLKLAQIKVVDGRAFDPAGSGVEVVVPVAASRPSESTGVQSLVGTIFAR